MVRHRHIPILTAPPEIPCDLGDLHQPRFEFMVVVEMVGVCALPHFMTGTTKQ